MDRRRFLAALCALPAARARPAAPSPRTLLIQRSPLAGFQYHGGEAVWGRLRVDQGVRLRREADNHYDKRAVRVEWRGRTLGYLPRMENAAVSQLLDNDVPLTASIERLCESRNPWERVVVEVVLRA